MNKIALATAFGILVSIISPAAAKAEAPMAPAGCPTRKIAIRSVEPEQQVALSGRVTSIEYGNQQHVAQKNMVMWLRLKTDRGEEVPVYLGSSWHLRKQQLQLRVGDRLQIRGVKTLGTALKQPMTIANTITKGQRTWQVSIPKKTNLVKSCQI